MNNRREVIYVSWFITIAVGAIVGWILALMMKRSWHTGMYTNMLLGAVGAIVGVWFFTFNLGIGTFDTSFSSFQGVNLLWDAIGAIATVYIINAVSYVESTVDEQRGEAPAYSAGTAHEYRSESRRMRRP